MFDLRDHWRSIFPDYMAGKGDSIGGKLGEPDELIDIVEKMPNFQKESKAIESINHGGPSKTCD